MIHLETHWFFKMKTWENKSWIWTVKTQRFFKIEHRNILDHWTLETEVESLKEQDRENHIMNVSTCTHVKVLEIELQEEEADGLILLPSFLHWKLSWSPSNKQSDWFSFSKLSPLTIIMDLACKNRLTYLPWWFEVRCGCPPIPHAWRVLQLCLQHHSDYYYASKFMSHQQPNQSCNKI